MNFPPLDYIQYITHDKMIKDATCIVKQNTARGDLRTPEQQMLDAVQGLILQFAVFEHLKNEGYKVEAATDFSYDFTLELDNEKFYVDVKGRFDSSARTYTMSRWEYDNALSEARYFCFDCRQGTGIYEGWASKEDFRPSNYNDRLYVFANALRK